MIQSKAEQWVGIVEDGLDVVMAVGSLGYLVLVNETAFELSPTTMAAIGGTAGTLRFLLRRLVMRIIDVRTGAA